MADVKISALPAATTPLDGTELAPIVQSGTTKRVTVANLTTGRALSASSLTLTTPLSADNGGTGQSSYTIGDLIYASGTTALSKLAGVATGNALISGGTGTAPSWGKVGLTTHVSGTLPVANGGTGLTSLTAGYIPYATATNTLGTSANLTFSGSKLTVGTAYANFGGTLTTFNGANVAQLNGAGMVTIGTTDAMAANLGGSLGLQSYESNIAANYTCATVSGRRENATAGNYAGYLAFGTTNSGGTISEVGRFDSSGNLLVGTTTAGTLLTVNGVATLCSGTATPANGSTSARLLFGTTSGFGIYYGSGAPTVSAAQGSIYLRSDGSSTSTRLYVNTNGSTTWTNVTTAA